MEMSLSRPAGGLTRRGTLSALERALLIVFFFGVYTHFELRFPVYVPEALCLASAAGLAITRAPTRRLVRAVGVAAVFATLVFCATALKSAQAGWGDFADRATSVALLGATLISAIIVADRLRLLSTRALFRASAGLLVFIALFGLAEILGPAKPISDFIRRLVYDEGIIYAGYLRDFALHGYLRPNVFASEPSHLGKVVAAAAVVAVLSARTRKAALFAFGVAVLAALIVRSPATAPGLIIAAGVFPFLRLPGARLERVAAVAIFALGVAAILIYGVSQIALRTGLNDAGAESSLFNRIQKPAFVAAEVIEDHPFFGLGYGADDAALSYHRVWNLDPSAPLHVRSTMADNVYANAHMDLLIFGGLVGTLAWMAALYLVLRTAGLAPVVALSFLGLYGFVIGPSNTTMYFVPIFIVALAATKAAAEGVLRLGPPMRSPGTIGRI